jgi:hypothetical protein
MQDASEEHHKVCRRINVHIRGSMEQFSHDGQEAASWMPVNGKAGDVFGVNDVFESTPDVGTTACVLQNAVLHSVRVLECRNDFPLNLGVTISCIPPEETIKTGHKYAMTTLAQSHNVTPLTIFEASDNNSEGFEWRAKYPNYNANNLESEGVLQVAGQLYVFVSKGHPVVELLRSNADKLNARIDEQPLIDGEWYKITKQVFSQCCQALRAKVLSKVSTRDMNDFSVQIHRLGNTEWANFKMTDELINTVPSDILYSGDEAKLSEAIKRVMKTNYSWSARLEVTYSVRT